MNRREFCLAGIAVAAGVPILAENTKLPSNLERLKEKILSTPFQDINTDWDGSIRMEALLRFAERGDARSLQFVKAWLHFHVDNDNRLTDAEYNAQYSGTRTRIVREKPLTFTLYSANLGVAFPAYILFKQSGESIGKEVAIEVADAILQFTARDKFGMLSDDSDRYRFAGGPSEGVSYAIPDTTYWATRACAIAASLMSTAEAREIYRRQSNHQLDAGIEHFLDKNLNIVRTGLFADRPATTHWCRSQGWLLWAIAGSLRELPRDHPNFVRYADTMDKIGHSLLGHQTANGSFHVLLDDDASPEECTGVAMVTAALMEGIRKGWIGREHRKFCDLAWRYVLKSVDESGDIHNVYTGWAATAEERKVDMMDQRFRGFAPGVLLLCADEMTRD